MRYVLNASQMKNIDAYSIKEIGIPSCVLMERAALEVAMVVQKNHNTRARIIAVCGSGNNGGDGIAAARILFHMGYQADILFLGSNENATGETRKQMEIAANMGIAILSECQFSSYDVCLDAIFGIGLTRDVEGQVAEVITQINQSGLVTYAVDIPSGVDADTGRIRGHAIQAAYTITFGYAKIGLLLYPGAACAGEVTVADIGFPKRAERNENLTCFTYDREDIKRLPVRPAYSNKGSFGKVLVIAGSKDVYGACHLCARAAYAAGAGLVKVLTAKENADLVKISLPEAIVLSYGTEAEVTSEQWEAWAEEIRQASALVIGPGIGLESMSSKLLGLVMETGNAPVILDADALHLLSQTETYLIRRKVEGFGDLVNLSDRFILTPHLKEMARLMHVDTREVADHFPEVALWATKAAGYTLVLKDARTMVTQQGKAYINCSGNNGMATGGSGDVLAGVIAALVAQGMMPYEAATLGVYLHGLAGDDAAAKKGLYSMIASDIIDSLAHVVDN